MAHKQATFPLLLLFTLAAVVGSTLAAEPASEDKVTLTIAAEGIPSTVSVRLFLNGTQAQDLLTSADPVVLEFAKGTTISISAEERVEGQLGFIYIRKSITRSESGEQVSMLTLLSDADIIVRFETSHILLQPIFWPLYATVIATAVLIAVRRWTRRATAG